MGLLKFLAVVMQWAVVALVSAQYGLRAGLLVVGAIVLNVLQCVPLIAEYEKKLAAKGPKETEGSDETCGNG